MNVPQKLSLLSLVLLISGAIDNVRNLPAAALFGSSLIFYFVIAGIIFFIPTALISAVLAANLPENGIYQWMRTTLGERLGFLAVWLQWINTMVWFPTILSFLVSTAAFIIDPALAEDKSYLILSILVLFWLVTFINFRGIRTSSKVVNVTTLSGLALPMAFFILLFLAWIIQGKPLQFHLQFANLIPNLTETENLITLSAVVASLLGMELSAVHIHDVEHPERTFPRAILISTVFVLVTMILGSLSIAMVIPKEQINLVNGTIRTFSYYLHAYGLEKLLVPFTVLLVIGTFGSMISWVISPLKGLSEAASNGFLPVFFRRKNKYGVAQNLLITQAILVSCICLIFLLFPSINASYWLLTTLTTQLYVMMYILMFVGTLVYLPKLTDCSVVPFGKRGVVFLCVLGIVSCLLTMCIGFIPPTNLNIGSPVYYEMIFVGGMMVMILPVCLFYFYKKKCTF